MTPDYELQEHQAQILTDHRMRELALIDRKDKVRERIWDYYRARLVDKSLNINK